MEKTKTTLLVVDDEPVLREIMAEWFKREGYSTLTAENGLVALEILAAHQVDVIISDIRMPVMDGMTMFREIKASGIYMPKIIFISGFSDISLREMYNLGVEAMVEKPFERHELLNALQSVLMDRGELWRQPCQNERDTILKIKFESLATALEDGSVAFGRGGFCIHSYFPLKEPQVRLALDFVTDKKKISGCGLVRWSSAAEEQMGIEISSLDDECRDWVVCLTGDNPTVSFIPETSRTFHGTMKKVN